MPKLFVIDRIKKYSIEWRQRKRHKSTYNNKSDRWLPVGHPQSHSNRKYADEWDRND